MGFSIPLSILVARLVYRIAEEVLVMACTVMLIFPISAGNALLDASWHHICHFLVPLHWELKVILQVPSLVHLKRMSSQLLTKFFLVPTCDPAYYSIEFHPLSFTLLHQDNLSVKV